MQRDWNIKNKVAVVMGRTAFADGVRAALAGEGATLAEDTGSSVDILVTIPDILHDRNPMPIGVDAQTWSGAMENLFEAPRRATHAVLPGMMERGFGRIVHVIGSLEPRTFNAEFAAWGAMGEWSKSLTRAIGTSGPTLNLVQAGLPPCEDASIDAAEELKAIPAGRYCAPDDIANLVVFLSSPFARYLTGTIIPVDGGMRRYQN